MGTMMTSHSLLCEVGVQRVGNKLLTVHRCLLCEVGVQRVGDKLLTQGNMQMTHHKKVRCQTTQPMSWRQSGFSFKMHR